MDVDTFPHRHVFLKVLKLHRILSPLNIIAFTIRAENNIQAANIGLLTQTSMEMEVKTISMDVEDHYEISVILLRAFQNIN